MQALFHLDKKDPWCDTARQEEKKLQIQRSLYL